MNIGEVINVDKYGKKDQMDHYGNLLPVGSVKIRLFSESPFQDPVDVWAAPAWHSMMSVPLRGEHVIVFKGPSYHKSVPYAASGLNSAYYYMPQPINTSDDLAFNQMPNSTHRSQNGTPPTEMLPGHYFPFPIRPQPVSQLFEGDFLLRGRQGTSIRLGMSYNEGKLKPWADNKPT